MRGMCPLFSVVSSSELSFTITVSFFFTPPFDSDLVSALCLLASYKLFLLKIPCEISCFPF